MRKAASMERRAGDKRLSPSAGKENADKMGRDIKYFDKLTKETKPSVVGMIMKHLILLVRKMVISIMMVRRIRPISI